MTASPNALVRAPADGGGSNGSGARRRGSRGRGGPSIVARRRPGRAKAEEAAAKNDDQAAEEEKPKPRSRRSGSSRRPSARATKAKAEAAATEAAATEAESPESPGVPVADIAEEPQAAPAEVAPPEVEEPKKPAVRRRTRAAATKSEEPPAALDSGGMNGLLREVASLRSLVEEQHGLMTELRAGLLSLGKQIDYAGPRPRLGVFVDVPNVLYGVAPDEPPINMGKLLDMIREGRELVRATAYSPVSDNPREPVEQQKFVAPFVPYEYRIVTKPLKRFADGSIKGNFDVEMAIDMVTMADRLDVIAFVSGDADFARAVETVQARGVRVEVVAFAGSTSLEMRALADGYLELGSVMDQLR